MSKSMRLSIALLMTLSLSVTAALAQKPRLLDKETFMEMESVGNPQISPDGKQIVFTRTWVDKVKDQSRSNLWIVDVDGNRVRELIGGARNDSSPLSRRLWPTTIRFFPSDCQTVRAEPNGQNRQ